ncbi:MAG: hypothetical protein V4542_10270 [Pseudomonadota bacterium]
MTMPSPASGIAPAPMLSGQVRLGAETFCLDHGGVVVAVWADEECMASGIQALDQRLDITVRLVSGTLIADLSLQDNLTLEAALYDGSLPRHLMPEIDSLFGDAGRPVDWPIWSSVFPDTAPAEALMQAKVGRALMADPDVLIIDAAQWDDALMDAQRFSQSFARQYPWRTLVWATHDMNRAGSLRDALKEFQA